MNDDLKDTLMKSLDRAQELSNHMKKAQSELDNQIVKGESGGGLITVYMTGRHDVKKLKIDDSLINLEDKEILEDLVAAAINDAVRKAEDVSQKTLESLTSDFDLPNLKDILP